MYAACGLVLAAYLTVRDREAAAARQAQEAQMARVRTERATMGARLKVMQARVEPELLFGVLTEVRALYLRAPAEAEALLDNLIDYLRAALPQMRGESSTLLKEAELAAVYLKVVPKGRSGHLAVELTIDDESGGIAFPPMFLLPLVHDAAESGATRIRLAAQVDSTSPTQITIAVEASPHAQWTSERLADLRRVAQRYLGEGARLEVHDTLPRHACAPRLSRAGKRQRGNSFVLIACWPTEAPSCTPTFRVAGGAHQGRVRPS